MTVREDLDGIVADALAHFDDNGPEEAGAWFLARFQQQSGVSELINDDRAVSILYAGAHGKDAFEAALRWMVDRAVRQRPQAS